LLSLNQDIWIYPASDKKLFSKIFPELKLRPCHFTLNTQNLIDKIAYKFLKPKKFFKYKTNNVFSKNRKKNLILSFEDNNIHLWQIEKNIPNTKVYLFQNGWRQKEFFDQFSQTTRNRYQVSRYFSLGHGQKKCFFGLKKTNIIPAGNIKNNFFRFKNEPRKKSILFISQFLPIHKIFTNKSNVKSYKFFGEIDKLIISICETFAKKNGAKVYILGRLSLLPNFSKLEKNYYKNITPSSKVLSPHHEKFTYNEISKHNLLVTVDSTLAYEAAAKGIKTCFFPIRSTNLHLSDRRFGFPQPFPETGFCWSNRFDKNKIMNILADNFNSTKESYSKRLKEIKFSDVIIYDPDNSIIKEELCNIK